MTDPLGVDVGSTGKTTEARPSTIEEYSNWARKTIAIEFDDRLATLTETNVRLILNKAQENAFFKDLPDTLDLCAKEYESKHPGARLLMRSVGDFELVPKSYQSIVNKSWRQNVIWNSRWPKPPRPRVAGIDQPDGWTTPENWYSRFDDIVRGTIVLRYIDGPQFLAEALAQYCSTHGIKASVESRALDEGYYAYHFYLQVPVVLLKQDWSELRGNVWVEIQLTTQLQEVARDLTHTFYAVRRLETKRDNEWKWDHGSERFKAAYISHSLHLIEGLIVELRDGIAKKATDSTAKESNAGSASHAEQQAPVVPSGMAGENPPQSTVLRDALPEQSAQEERRPPKEELPKPSTPEDTRGKTSNG